MRTTYIKSVTRPDGYFGDTATAHLCLDGNQLVEVHPSGFIRSPALPMDFANSAEALWHVENHPAAKRFYS